MADPQFQSMWHYKSAWEGCAVPGLVGLDGPEKIRVSCERLRGAALIIADLRDNAGFTKAMEAAYGLIPPSARRYTVSPSLELIWAGPGKWLALSDDLLIASSLSKALSGHATVSDQSGSRGFLCISGCKARDMLAKGLGVDLHPSSFGASHTALSSIAHMNVHIWQIDEAPSYRLAVARSMAASFWAWLAAAGSEFGLVISNG